MKFKTPYHIEEKIKLAFIKAHNSLRIKRETSYETCGMIIRSLNYTKSLDDEIANLVLTLYIVSEKGKG